MLLVPDSSLLIHLGDSDTCTEWKKYDNNLKSANVQYRLHHTVVTSDGCNTRHSENYENILKFPVKAKTLCKLVKSRYKANFRYETSEKLTPWIIDLLIN